MAATNTSLLARAVSFMGNTDNSQNNWLMVGQRYRRHERRFCISDALVWIKSYIQDYKDVTRSLYYAREYAMSCRSEHVLNAFFDNTKKRLTVCFTDGSKAILACNGPFLQATWQRRSNARVVYVYGTFKTVHTTQANGLTRAYLQRIF